MISVEELLQQLVERGGSDLHITAGAPPKIRIDGKLISTEHAVLDPETYGGAMLLGVNGVCIISHGSSSERAIVNAIGVARDMVEHEVVAEMSATIRPD